MKYDLKLHWKYINWGSTLKLNIFRAFVTGFILSLLLMIFSGMPFDQSLLAFLLMPPMILTFGLIFILLQKMNVPFVGLFILLFACYFAVGDFFVYMLKDKVPSMVPVKDFKPFNFAVLMFVFDFPPGFEVNL